MSYSQEEEIEMAEVYCRNPKHEGEFIRTLCLNTECQESSPLCTKCLIKSHIGCRDYVEEIEVIPQQLIELQQLQSDIIAFQEKINQPFKVLLSRIEQILMPISKYQNMPNFTNLNGIGYLLRQFPKLKILESIDEMKKNILMLLLENKQNPVTKPRTPNSINKNQEPLIQNNSKQYEPKQDVEFDYQKGLSLYCDKQYNEAFNYFNQAILIDSKDDMSWYFKGETLQELNKYDEAIQCYDKAISINPKNCGYWDGKGQTLQLMGRLEESIQYFEEALKLDPNWQSAKLSLEEVKLQVISNEH